MDDQLKEDIKEAFFDEYRKREEAKAGSFVKVVRSFFKKADEVVGKAGLSGISALLLFSIAAAALAPPIGVPLMAAWFVGALTNVGAMIGEVNRADKAVNADTDNGKLTVAYHAVLDKKERELSETQDLYKAQRAQLPAKGAATESFAAAVAGVLETPKAAAPAQAPTQLKP